MGDHPYRVHREVCDAVATAAERTADCLRRDLDHHSEEAWRTFAVQMRAISSGAATVEATNWDLGLATASPAIANLHRLADLNPIPKGET